eukprot:scpid34237/ scgid0126/ 
MESTNVSAPSHCIVAENPASTTIAVWAALKNGQWSIPSTGARKRNVQVHVPTRLATNHAASIISTQERIVTAEKVTNVQESVICQEFAYFKIMRRRLKLIVIVVMQHQLQHLGVVV